MLAKNIMIFITASVLFTGCETISESECAAGNWADLGYRDGVNGTDRARIADYVERCGEFGQEVDRNTYLTSYESGLVHYCTYDNGFERGEDGASYNTVCEGPQAADFRAGYDNGHYEYELHQQYDRFENNIDDLKEQINDVEARLADTALEVDERVRLNKKNKRLNSDLKDLRWNFRNFRRKNDLD